MIRPTARLATVTTTVLVTVVLLTRLIAADGSTTRPIVRNYHILDTLAMAALLLGAALLLMAFVTIPPVALAVTSVGLVAVEGGAAISAGYLAAGTLTIAASAMFNEASSNYDDWPNTGVRSDSGSVRFSHQTKAAGGRDLRRRAEGIELRPGHLRDGTRPTSPQVTRDRVGQGHRSGEKTSVPEGFRAASIVRKRSSSLSMVTPVIRTRRWVDRPKPRFTRHWIGPNQ